MRLRAMVYLSIVVPTYNERENICELLSRIHGVLSERVDYEVIVVDDDSPDGTWKVAEECGSRLGRVRVIRRLGERGLSSAIMRGIEEARGEVVAVMDADLQHPPEVLPSMLEKMRSEGVDVVIASRYVRGGGVEGWSMVRRLISRGAILVGKIVEPRLREVKDPISGYFMFRKNVLDNVKLELLGYKFLVELLARGNYRRVEEVPYVFKPRARGKSKLGFGEILKYVKLLLRITNYRVLKFSLVGASGILVNEGVLFSLVEGLSVPVAYASPIAIWLSILSNFTLNELWTFRGRGDRGASSILRRLVKYHGATLLGGIVNYATLLALVTLGVNYLLANLVGILLGFIINYTLSEHMVWSR